MLNQIFLQTNEYTTLEIELNGERYNKIGDWTTQGNSQMLSHAWKMNLTEGDTVSLNVLTSIWSYWNCWSSYHGKLLIPK